jgi:hypothetical protein
LYREILRENTSASPARPPATHPLLASGLWTHIRGPVINDPGIWSTGNAWAAAGMMRILATLVKFPLRRQTSWHNQHNVENTHHRQPCERDPRNSRCVHASPS